MTKNLLPLLAVLLAPRAGAYCPDAQLPPGGAAAARIIASRLPATRDAQDTVRFSALTGHVHDQGGVDRFCMGVHDTCTMECGMTPSVCVPLEGSGLAVAEGALFDIRTDANVRLGGGPDVFDSCPLDAIAGEVGRVVRAEAEERRLAGIRAELAEARARAVSPLPRSGADFAGHDLVLRALAEVPADSPMRLNPQGAAYSPFPAADVAEGTGREARYCVQAGDWEGRFGARHCVALDGTGFTRASDGRIYDVRGARDAAMDDAELELDLARTIRAQNAALTAERIERELGAARAR